MSGGTYRAYILVGTIIVIGIVLVGTGVYLFVFPPGPGQTTTTPTTTTTSPTTTSPTTTAPVDIPNPYQVAIVFATGGLGDQGFNDAVYSGALNAYFDYDINFTYTEPMQIAQYETYLRQFAAHNGYIDMYDIIISVGFDLADALMAVAEDYPEQKFAIIDIYIDPITYPNVASLLFDEHEGSALVGAIAGLTTTTDMIGFVGGMDIPLINKFLAGYVFGAGHVNPSLNDSANIAANVTIDYTNDWVDTTAGHVLADGMYEAGADIVFAAAGPAGLGVFDSVKDKNTTSSVPLWCIGVDQPQMRFGTADPENPAPPTLCLTSMLKRLDIAVYTIIEEWVVDNTWQTGYDLIHIFNLANNGVGYEVNEELLVLPPDVITAVETFKAEIIAGTVVVPDTIYWT
jgi:basic membrane protein A